MDAVMVKVLDALSYAAEAVPDDVPTEARAVPAAFSKIWAIFAPAASCTLEPDTVTVPLTSFQRSRKYPAVLMAPDTFRWLTGFVKSLLSSRFAPGMRPSVSALV